MITKFSKFNEKFDANDMKNSLDYGVEQQSQTNANPQSTQPNDPTIKNAAQLKITDIQNRIGQLNQQRKLISDEIIKLQNAQRDLMPNNPDDPNNAKNQKEFTEDQTEKVNIQQSKLLALNNEIKNLQKEMSRNQQKYM